MGKLLPLRPDPPPPPHGLHDHALEHLRYIRSTMERASSFTAVPGLGGVAMGLSALAAAWFAHRQPGFSRWFDVWVIEGILAFAIGGLAMFHKARSSGEPLWSEPARKFALGFLPPVFAAAVLSIPLYQMHHPNALVAAWLILYGAAAMAGGAFSARIVPAMGAAFLVLGTAALFIDPGLCDLAMAAGFGGLHIVFGLWIWRKYGG